MPSLQCQIAQSDFSNGAIDVETKSKDAMAGSDFLGAVRQRACASWERDFRSAGGVFMGADGIAIGIGKDLSDAAKAYFKRHPKLPPKGLAIVGVTVPTGVASFETLLGAIKNSKLTCFLVYAHGHNDGSGLYLQLAAPSSGVTGQQTTGPIVETLTRLCESDTKATDRELGFLGIDASDLGRLKGLMNDVRSKKIDVFEFRGCNLGRNPGTMKAFKTFLGATTFGAPDYYSFFGPSNVKTGKHWVDNNDKNLVAGDGDWHTYTYNLTNPDGTVISNIATDDALKPIRGNLVADSVATMQRFVKSYIDPQDSFDQRETSVLLHGMWDTGKRKIDTSAVDNPIGTDPNFVDPHAILPNTDEYKNHVVYI
jgi:hypothetical protein